MIDRQAAALLKAGRRLPPGPVPLTLELPIDAWAPERGWCRRPVEVKPCPDCAAPYVAAIFRSPELEERRALEVGRNPNTKRIQQRLAAAISRASRCDVCKEARLQQQKATYLETAKQKRKQAAAEKQAFCAHCVAPFKPQRSTALFCSTTCRVAHHRSQKKTPPTFPEGQTRKP